MGGRQADRGCQTGLCGVYVCVEVERKGESLGVLMGVLMGCQMPVGSETSPGGFFFPTRK